MEAKSLKFNNTQTVGQFCASQGVSEITVHNSPKKNGKLIFAYGTQIGAVSSKGVPTKPVVSNVTGEDGNSFYLLHEQADLGPATVTFK